MRQVGRVAIAWIGAHLTGEELGHLLALDVDGRHDDVARTLVHQLEDALAEVTLDDVDTACHEVGVQLALLAEHGLTLHQALDAVLLQ